MGHGLQHGIVELNRARDEQGVVRRLGRHGGLWSRCRKKRSVERFILDIVGSEGVSLGREGGVELGQRQALIQVSGDQAEALRR